VLCDYLAGMTDAFAARIYKRLFDADFGSIVDLV
jgi:dGTPase